MEAADWVILALLAILVVCQAVESWLWWNQLRDLAARLRRLEGGEAE